MKRIKILLNIILMALCLSTAAQVTDEKALEKEIRIMESILSEVFSEGGNHSVSKKSITGNYIQDYGVVFKVNQMESIYMVSSIFGHSDTPKKTVNKKGLNIDSLAELTNQRIKKNLKSFIVDYGDLISQLNTDDHIMVIWNGKGLSIHTWISDMETLQNRQPKIAAQVSFAEIQQYRSGKINKQQLESNIKVTTNKNKANRKEFEVLARIFDSLVENHSHQLRKTTYDHINGLGVIYNLSLNHWDLNFPKIYSLGGKNEESNKGQSQKAQGLNSTSIVINSFPQGKNQKEFYEKFEKEIRQYIIRYGKTLRSLHDSEMLIVNTKLSNCYNCSIPEKLSATVKASVLKDFDSGKITLEQAMNKVKLKEQGIKED